MDRVDDSFIFDYYEQLFWTGHLAGRGYNRKNSALWFTLNTFNEETELWIANLVSYLIASHLQLYIYVEAIFDWGSAIFSWGNRYIQNGDTESFLC